MALIFRLHELAEQVHESVTVWVASGKMEDSEQVQEVNMCLISLSDRMKAVVSYSADLIRYLAAGPNIFSNMSERLAS